MAGNKSKGQKNNNSKLPKAEKKDETTGATATKSTTTTIKSVPVGAANSSNGSLISRVLLYLTLIGMGVLGGYLMFTTIYNHRCADLLDDAEGRHNSTRSNLETRYKTALEEHHECIGDESATLQIYELRGRIEQLETIARTYPEWIKRGLGKGQKPIIGLQKEARQTLKEI